MKCSGQVTAQMRGKKLGSGAAAAWLLLPIVFLLVLKADFLPQFARIGETSTTKVADEMVQKVSSSGFDAGRQPIDAEKLGANTWLPSDSDEKPTELPASAGTAGSASDSPIPKQNQQENTSHNLHIFLGNSDVGAPRSKLTCDYSSYYMDTCVMAGDIRVQGSSSTVFVVSPSDYRPETATPKIRPYPRKWEKDTMKSIREITILSTPQAAAPADAPPCRATHDMPAVVFSTGGFSVNVFHTMNDVIIPLYITTREYNGRVQLLATSYDPKWIAKYREMVSQLSDYPVVDLDADTIVRCFPSAHVGLESHKVLGIDPVKSRNNYTMIGFRDFLRSAYSMPRQWAAPISKSSGGKPRLVMVLRRKSRALTNEPDVVSMAAGLGFDVVAAGPEQTSDVAGFARVVNSCDVMMGVHGAGLTNMVFLPHNATVVQIIPWGGMKWPSWYDYGEPVPAMGLRYVEYEVNAEETTLKYVYPRDHPVFTDPISIHQQGFHMLWSTFLNGQNVTLNVDRFRGVLQEVYQSIMTY